MGQEISEARTNRTRLRAASGGLGGIFFFFFSFRFPPLYFSRTRSFTLGFDDSQKAVAQVKDNVWERCGRDAAKPSTR